MAGTNQVQYTIFMNISKACADKMWSHVLNNINKTKLKVNITKLQLILEIT